MPRSALCCIHKWERERDYVWVCVAVCVCVMCVSVTVCVSFFPSGDKLVYHLVCVCANCWCERECNFLVCLYWFWAVLPLKVACFILLHNWKHLAGTKLSTYLVPCINARLQLQAMNIHFAAEPSLRMKLTNGASLWHQQNTSQKGASTLRHS